MPIYPDDDFHRLEALDRLLAEASERGLLEPSPEALRAHLDTGTPGEPITDPAVLAEFFG